MTRTTEDNVEGVTGTPRSDDLSIRWGSQRHGVRAKASYLVSVLSGDTATPAERTLAVLALLEDFDAIAGSLEPADLSELRSVLNAATAAAEAHAATSIALVPDDDVSGIDAIDGLNVRRVIIPPAAAAAAGGHTASVARFDTPAAAGRVVVVSEYTLATNADATISLVDLVDSREFEVTRLTSGHSRFVTQVLEITPAETSRPMEIRVTNTSASSTVLWYRSDVHSLPEATPTTTMADYLHAELRTRRDPDRHSVFAPITREPLALTDIERLAGLRDQFRGERIFIMGNGPSLNRTPLELLENDYVFGVNRISLLFERVSWRPTFFTAFDVRVVPDNQEEFADLDIEYKFFSARYKPLMGERDNHYWYHTKGFYEGFETCFEPTVPYSGFGGGGTIGVIATELAFYMGFREIYLIGTDVSYSIPKTAKQSGADQFGDGVKLELQSTRDDDANHFDPRYFGKDKKWHNPNVREMKIGFARTAAYMERHGGRLLNATVGGELDEVPRVDFGSLF